MKNLFLIISSTFLGIVLHGQTDSTQVENKSSLAIEDGKLSYSLYIDNYYAYDFNQPYDGYRQSFLYQYDRHNEFNINRAVMNLSYKSKYLEANVGFNAGTFPNEFMGGRDTLFRYVYEANFKLIPNDKFDVTIGMMAPHFGYESGLSYENMTVSQSMVSEATPYYIMGVKSYYHATENFDIGLTVANGWQNIYKNPGAGGIGVGLHLFYEKENDFQLSYANYLYNDTQDAPYSLYNEIYAKKQLGKKITLLSGFSLGLVSEKGDQFKNNVGIFTLMGQYKLSEKVALGARYEHLEDGNGVYLNLPRPGYGLFLDGASLNLDWSPMNLVKFRLEGRVFTSQKDIYKDDRDYDPDTSTEIAYRNVAPSILASIQVKIH